MKLLTMKIVVAIFVGFILGSVVGGGTALYASAIFQSDAAYARFIADATLELSVLEKLHAGDEESAASILNNALDGNMAALDISDPRMPKTYHEHVKDLLDKVDNYRKMQISESQ